MKPNEWLEKKDFIERVDFHDLYYFRSLAKHLSSYLKIIPIPVLTTWDPVHKRIYCSVGQDKKFFKVDIDISYWDYITMINRWVQQFFPKYEVEIEKEEALTEDEIINRMEEDPSVLLNDLLLEKKVSTKIEKGIITKIHLTNDEFNLNINGMEYIRISGNINNPMSLSIFLKLFRELKEDTEKRNFIFMNSEELKVISSEKKDIEIDYKGSMMLNFISIQYLDLKEFDFIQNNNGTYKWGRYIIKFDTYNNELDCINYLKRRFQQDNIESKIQVL